MASFTKFQDFVEQIGLKQHNLNTDTLKVALTNTLPVNTQTVFDPVTNHAAPAAANGYPAGGSDIQNAWSESGGTATLTATDVVFTASGGQIGPFRYAVIYNDTNATDMLVAWYDYGSSITLNDGETFTVDFGATTLTIA
jgi:hypothetical protein